MSVGSCQPVAHVIEDANDTMNANIDTSMPLFGRVIGEISCAAEISVDTSNEMEEDDVDGPGADTLWLPEDFSVGPLSVKVDSLWHQDAINLGYLRLVNNLYKFPEGYRLVLREGSIVRECPPGYVVVYTHHLEFGLRFPLDSFW